MDLSDLCGLAWSWIDQDPDEIPADEAVGQAIGHLIDDGILIPAVPYDEHRTGGVCEGLLTDQELVALRLSGALAGAMRRTIEVGPQFTADLAEMVHEIHVIQHRILRQAAARAYPDLVRLLGESLP